MSDERHDMTRRGFLLSSAAALAAASIAQGAEKPATSQPGERRERKRHPLATTKSKYNSINVACIGIDGRGRGDLEGIIKAGANVIAICDIDSNKLDKCGSELPDARKYADFRELLDKEQKNLDAVVVATPDHTHAPAAMMAMKLGKHVYCEKPLTYDIYEARMLTQAAKKYGVKTQMGNQGMADDKMRRQVEYVRSGCAGPIKEVHVFTNRPIWPQGLPRPTKFAPPPRNINFDLWLGPAPERPYHVDDKGDSVYLPFKWRGWWDFGTGALGDMACHLMNTAYWALNLTNPASVESISYGKTDVQAPNWSIIKYEFPQLGARPPVTLFWYDGDMLPTDKLTGGKPIPGDHNGTLFVGEKATITAPYMGEPHFTDEAMDKEVGPKIAKTIPRSIGHHEEWLEAIQGGPDAFSAFDHSGPLTEMVLLGNLAVRTGRRIEWDVSKMKVTNDKDAQKFVRREYRKGWEL